MRSLRRLQDRMSAAAWDIRDELEKAGRRIHAVVVRGDGDVEIYYYDDEENEEDVRRAVAQAKERRVTPPREIVEEPRGEVP